MPQLVEGLTEFTPQQGYVNRGRLPLPEGFDEKRFVGKWVKNGPSVKIAQQSEPIASEGVIAQGWSVWRDTKTKQLCQRTLSTGIYILMFRPRVLQEAINKCYGNSSRRRMIQEAEGKTVAGQMKQDAGIWTKETLDKIPGLRAESGDALEAPVPFNDLTPSEVETPTEARATTNIRTKQKIRSEE